jgi:hypothetical protein
MLTRLAEDLRTRERKIIVPPMKQESLWFKLCLGENSHLHRGLEDNLPDDQADDGEGEEDDDQTPSSDPLELNSQKENLLREFSLYPKTAASPAAVSQLPLSDSGQDKDRPIQYSVGVIPTTSLMLQFDQVLTQRLLGYHMKWLTKRVTRIRALYETRSVGLLSLVSHSFPVAKCPPHLRLCKGRSFCNGSARSLYTASGYIRY